MREAEGAWPCGDTSHHGAQQPRGELWREEMLKAKVFRTANGMSIKSCGPTHMTPPAPSFLLFS